MSGRFALAPGRTLRRPTPREGWGLTLVGVLALLVGVDALVRTVYVPRRDALRSRIAAAEQRLQRHARLEAEADAIRATYEGLRARAGARARLRNESEVLREVEARARGRVELLSLLPVGSQASSARLNLEFRGNLEAIAAYVAALVQELGGEVTALNLAAAGDGSAGVQGEALCTFALGGDGSAAPSAEEGE